ncbi:LytTR family DNA-binding domain-containing protein [Teredinibacter sp. KSP-S5-2]|uniref:LytR/AlgR family response regulator transcription factor n=1 Tax=Teredinibacter sp. KSP-S5-2 TaxID=3034506 RepID=UPI0029352F5D|nr:LytTR family DNA-binding domain-containing protein [Teredinibacter sp. KSP-S5-2]WNO09324.1 LytTR family DNA-binding domain-containing protein [Teredinibacter sp. KSP-S5-2]
MHVLIVDDEPLARRRLAKMVETIEDCELVGEADNGNHAIEQVNACDPDIVFMDVRMPEKDGLEAAREISLMPDPPAVIFCTAYDEYALEAFETLASGYLLKPVKEEQLIAAIEKARKITRAQKKASTESDVEESADELKQRQHISAKTRRGIELVPIENVLCFVADHKYVTVIHHEGETLVDDTLKDLEAEFADKFVRIHRNSLVSIAHIEAMERSSAGQFEIRLKQSEYRPVVSRRHVSGVRELLSRL